MATPLILWLRRTVTRWVAARVLAAALFAALFVFAASPAAQEADPPAAGGRHRGLAADTACSACHSTEGWSRLKSEIDLDFLHASTGFGLFGAHAAATCDACHDGRGLARESAGCAACHGDPHRGEQGTSCENCHNEQSFEVRIVDGIRKHRETRLPLLGAHAVTDCGACHLNVATGRFAGLDATCFACHADAFASTQSPPHAASGLGTDCESCHTQRAWFAPTQFHNRVFALRGQHAVINCDACHAGNVFQGTPTDCFACHAADFDASTNPPHATAGFSTACDSCHVESGWVPASRFRHDLFPLQGRHAQLACDSCHQNNVFLGTPSDCFSCHATDYNQTTAPAHTGAGFPVTCQDCHSQSAWQPASFDHERFFPINSGDHRRFRADCNACHPQPANKSVFTCVSCHDHRQSEMDDEHRNVRGYVYSSPSCLGCHPDGRD